MAKRRAVKPDDSGQDVSVNGPGSPASLKKIIKYCIDPKSEGPHILIDDGSGIVKDDPETIIITPEDCKAQALYFLENFFKKTPKPPYYAVRHLLALYEREGCGYDYSHTGKAKYPDNESVKMAAISGGIKEDDDYKFLVNKFTYGEHDPEFLQLLGLIQLVTGSVGRGSGRIFIDYPETFLHPKRERIVLSMLEEIKFDITGQGRKPVTA